MKFVVAFAFAFFVGALAASGDKDDAQFTEYATACIAETGVDLITVLDNIGTGKIADNKQFSCFAACILKKYYILTSDGNLNGLLIYNLPHGMPKDDVDRILQKCKNIDDADVCRKAGKLLDCFLEDDLLANMLR